MKYPRTPHLPNSPGRTRDDRVISPERLDSLLGVPLILTEKLDGSNTALRRDALYARSHSGAPAHPSFYPLKGLHAEIRDSIPAGTTIFAEWCWARHSQDYPLLKGATPAASLHVFAVADDPGTTAAERYWWNWRGVESMAEIYGLALAPKILAPYTAESVSALSTTVEDAAQRLSAYSSGDTGRVEGVVARVASGFTESYFGTSVAKWVRAGFVAGEHWTKGDYKRHGEV